MLFGRGKNRRRSADRSRKKVRMVSLTGSIATGEHIIGHTASSVKRTHMELGGKAPVIVFDDADLDAVVEGVRTFGFYNAGQDCTAACRIYAQKEGFTPRWSKSWAQPFASLKMGAPDDASTELGPLSSAAHLSRVCAAVDRSQPFDISASSPVAVKRGGRDITSSQRCWPGRSRKMRSSSEKCLARWSA